jgi:hypothetical protein
MELHIAWLSEVVVWLHLGQQHSLVVPEGQLGIRHEAVDSEGAGGFEVICSIFLYVKDVCI